MKKINEGFNNLVRGISVPTGKSENEVDPLTGELHDFDTTDSITGAKTLKDIINLPYTEFIQKLTGKNPPSEGKSVAEIDSKVTKVLSLGKEDMKIEDEVIPVNDAADLQVKNLFPTQAQIGLLDSIGFVAFVLPENAKNALINNKADFKGERILTANNKYILDGHHRWSQTYLLNPDATIPALNLTLNVKDENEMLKIVQLAIAATYGSIAMKAANAATDIYDDTIISKWNTEYKIEGNSTLGLVKAVLEGKFGTLPEDGGDIKNVEKFIEIIKNSKGLENREAVEKYLAKNADLLKANNNKPEGAPPRSIMPQPGDTAKAVGKGKEKIAGIPADFVNKIKSGELNYKSDFIRLKTESKESKWIKTFEQFRNKN